MKRLLHSLRIRLILPAVLIITGSLIVLTLLMTHSYTQTLIQEKTSQTYSALSLVSSTLAEDLTEVQQAAIMALYESDVQAYLRQDYSSSGEVVKARIQYISSMNLVLKQQPNMAGVIFFREDGSVLGSFTDRTLFYDTPQNVQLSERLLQAVNQLTLYSSGVLGLYSEKEIYGFVKKKDEERNFLLLFKKAYTFQLGAITVVSAIEQERLQDYLKLIAEENCCEALTDAKGSVVSCWGEELQLESEQISALQKRSAFGEAVTDQGGIRYYAYVMPLQGTDLYLMKTIPLSQFDANVFRMVLRLWLPALLVLLISILIYFRWYRAFMKCFDSMSQGIARMKTGRLESAWTEKTDITEFENIRTEFNQMNLSLARMMETNRKMEREQLELQVKNLQTQLSPHMIFNSLTAIRWLANLVGADGIADMLMELSEMLRPVFREWHIEWTLGEELEHLQHYSRLLELRFRNQFHMEIHVPREYESLMIPRFTLQPLVENACEHGGNPEGELKVEITLTTRENFWHLSVWNSGEGMTDEKISQIMAMLAAENANEKVGLCNVYTRLKLCRGKESFIRLSRSEKGGTLVELGWPVKKE